MWGIKPRGEGAQKCEDTMLKKTNFLDGEKGVFFNIAIVSIFT